MAAFATSNSVDVNSSNTISVGGNGITATSSAVADADLDQSAVQSNENTQTTTATRFRFNQNFSQRNSSEQDGTAVAAASSDYVKVNQSGSLSAGGNGITAISSAEALAEMEQTAEQSNSNTVNVALQEPVAAGIVADPEQSNESDQDGAVIATAASDYVEVEQTGSLSAGGTGISAISSAVATAQLEQTAAQRNDSAPTANGPDLVNGEVTLSARSDKATRTTKTAWPSPPLSPTMCRSKRTAICRPVMAVSSLNPTLWRSQASTSRQNKRTAPARSASLESGSIQEKQSARTDQQ